MLDHLKTVDPEKSFTDPDEKGAACAITITTQLSTNRSIVVQTYMGRDDPLEQYNSVVDKLRRVVDRQEAVLQVESWTAELETRERTLKYAKIDYGRIEERAQAAWESRGKKGAFKLEEKDLQAKLQSKANIERAEEECARLRSEIAKARGIVISEE
jgi:hypothetical protein